ncbi:MAG: exodeoxyribonuclease V subunit alpha [Gammaproteobacteria bacterium]
MTVDQPFSRLDHAFARFLGRLAALESHRRSDFETLVAKLSYEQNQGHSCLQVSQVERDLALASGLASETGTRPLVLEFDRLYLQRYWFYEQRLARQLQGMIQVSYPADNLVALQDRYFAGSASTTDWQREAAQKAVVQAFSIITGGPGTGKTTTVVKILALLQELAQQPLLIALAAPTGKAAMRLQEAIGFSKYRLPCSESVKQLIPETVTTLHRLLGARPPSPYFRHDAGQPLPHDLVVVDEASMVDLALMSKLVDALKPGGRLILLGDKDQLASVESGAVLADLTAALPEHTVELQKSHRFEAAIKKLAEAVNRQLPQLAWAALQQQEANIGLLGKDLIENIAERQADYLRLMQKGSDFAAIIEAFNRFQVLCANRQGKNGVSDINFLVEQKLASMNLITLSGSWYAGRPVMVTQNNAGLHLYNGDIGLCLPDAEQGGKLMVFFQRPDGSVKKYLPARVPHCQTVFAMTIHKSQGSEFEEVLIVLPEQYNPVLTKELLYTAITRAKQTVKLAASEAVFTETVQRKIQRFGGLADKLRACPD